MPGDSFQPFAADFKDPPFGDILWPRVGVTLVSKRVKDTTEQLKVPNLYFCTPSISLKNHQDLYQIVCTKEVGSESRRGTTIECKLCGRVEYSEESLPLEKKLSSAIHFG